MDTAQILTHFTVFSPHFEINLRNPEMFSARLKNADYSSYFGNYYKILSGGF